VDHMTGAADSVGAGPPTPEVIDDDQIPDGAWCSGPPARSARSPSATFVDKPDVRPRRRLRDQPRQGGARRQATLADIAQTGVTRHRRHRRDPRPPSRLCELRAAPRRRRRPVAASSRAAPTSSRPRGPSSTRPPRFGLGLRPTSVKPANWAGAASTAAASIPASRATSLPPRVLAAHEPHRPGPRCARSPTSDSTHRRSCRKRSGSDATPVDAVTNPPPLVNTMEMIFEQSMTMVVEGPRPDRRALLDGLRRGDGQNATSRVRSGTIPRRPPSAACTSSGTAWGRRGSRSSSSAPSWKMDDDPRPRLGLRIDQVQPHHRRRPLRRGELRVGAQAPPTPTRAYWGRVWTAMKHGEHDPRRVLRPTPGVVTQLDLPMVRPPGLVRAPLGPSPGSRRASETGCRLVAREPARVQTVSRAGDDRRSA